MRAYLLAIAGMVLTIGQTAPSIAAPRDRFFWLSRDQQGFRRHDRRARHRAKAAGRQDFRRHQPRRCRRRPTRRGAIRRLSDGREGSDGGRRPRHQPAAFRPQPAGYRLDHAAPDQPRRFPDRVRETERHARGDPGAGGAGADAIIPAYTWGVQAQPITLGHYLSGYAAAFDREATRMREAYARLNQSPLGAAALGTSSFPVDRPRLAELLGFDAPVENSYDANQISPIDGGAELAGLATSGALVLGRADRRRHRAIRPDRAVDRADRGQRDRRQQHHAAEAQSERAGAICAPKPAR